MKKYYFLMVAMMMAMLSMGLTACGSDDDKDEPESSDIVGTWKFSGTEDGVTFTDLIQFTKDGKFNEVEIYTEDGETETAVLTGTYNVSGNVVTITETDEYGDTETYPVNFQVKGKKLIFSVQGYSIEYTKVNDSEIKKYL